MVGNEDKTGVGILMLAGKVISQSSKWRRTTGGVSSTVVDSRNDPWKREEYYPSKFWRVSIIIIRSQSIHTRYKLSPQMGQLTLLLAMDNAWSTVSVHTVFSLHDACYRYNTSTPG